MVNIFGFVDQNSGYLVREHFDHSKLFTCIISNFHKLLIMCTDLAGVVNKIVGQWKMVTDKIAELDNYLQSAQCSASYMRNWEEKSSEKKKLTQCLTDIIGSMMKAVEELHKCDHVSMNIRG